MRAWDVMDQEVGGIRERENVVQVAPRSEDWSVAVLEYLARRGVLHGEIKLVRISLRRFSFQHFYRVFLLVEIFRSQNVIFVFLE